MSALRGASSEVRDVALYTPRVVIEGWLAGAYAEGRGELVRLYLSALAVQDAWRGGRL